jgi:hypothetical protein
MRYRVYLIDEADRIKAAETFMALDDAEALEMAAVVLRATRDVFARHEVWCGPRRISGASSIEPSAGKSLVELAEERQIRALALEERLLSSFECIRRSRSLLQAVTELTEHRSDQARHADSLSR